ncbi:sensor histidine kinase N-terminal domain-containing protein [Marinomonas sp. 15G1-11]|uniref:histidine kinase n=1 Tax=Marinomonas phaeophyticola TaxID=3004091 RepID=A0ABT4JW44_9GAMM|nr:sensor histidine kinase [Marinomonas sp. 15G1-11]MCZ2722441.1 sensor histidine kinase N-terminal domain-containing protein [Marinomonas sp. 15G1-11]
MVNTRTTDYWSQFIVDYSGGGDFFIANAYGKSAAQLSYDRVLFGSALQVVENIKLINNIIVVDLPVSAFQGLSLSPDDRAFYQVIADNQHLTGYEDLSSAFRPKKRIRRVDGPYEAEYFDGVYSAEKVRFIKLSRKLIEGELQVGVVVYLAQTLQSRNEMAHDISVKALQLVSVIFTIALSVCYVFIWFIVRPIRRLNTVLSERAPTDLTPIDTDAPKEISELLRTINHFMMQLQNTLDRLKHFTSETAHQVRTPLAGILAQSQNALMENDKPKRHSQITQVIDSCESLSRTVDQLLNQALLAHRFKSKALEKVWLGALIKEVSRDQVLTALQQKVELAYIGPNDDCQIVGDTVALKKMLQNIIENAIKYSPKQGVVEITLIIEKNREINDIRPRYGHS